MRFCHPTISVKALKETGSIDSQPVVWPHRFFIHHRTLDGRGIAPFMTALQCSYHNNTADREKYMSSLTGPAAVWLERLSLTAATRRHLNEMSSACLPPGENNRGWHIHIIYQHEAVRHIIPSLALVSTQIFHGLQATYSKTALLERELYRWDAISDVKYKWQKKLH